MINMIIIALIVTLLTSGCGNTIAGLGKDLQTIGTNMTEEKPK